MIPLNPDQLFARVARDVPDELHGHIYVVGSMACAYHFRANLIERTVYTKDADLVVHPAGAPSSCKHIAMTLLGEGWRRTVNPSCHAMAQPEPHDELRAIRLNPPNSTDYFIEFLSVPQPDQLEYQKWIPVKLDDGWYGLPSFRFLALTHFERYTSSHGIEYATPPLMALAHLLSHRKLGTQRISAKIDGKRVLRSAKDLGRVLAIAELSGRAATESWPETWLAAIEECFPTAWRMLAKDAGAGLRQLLNDRDALDEAWLTCDVGLLLGRSTTAERLQDIGERLLMDAVEPLKVLATR